MKKINRLLKNEEFQKCISFKHVNSNKSFISYNSPNYLDHIRIGISVSKKIGDAVTRNKVKRQVRMMCQDTFDVSLPLDVVIIIRSDYLNFNYQFNLENMKFIYNKILKENKYEQKN